MRSLKDAITRMALASRAMLVLFNFGAIVLGLYSNSVKAQTHGIEGCQFRPSPSLARNQPIAYDRVYFAPVIGATAKSPMTIRLSAYSSLWFYWRWQGNGLGAKVFQRVEIDKVLNTGLLHSFCRTGWVKIDRLGLTNRVELPSLGGALWAVRIYERNDSPAISIIDPERSSVMVSGPIAAEPQFTPKPRLPFDAFAGVKEADAPTCAANASVPTDARRLGAWQLPGGALDVPGILYAVGGRHVYMRVAGASGSVRVVLYAKMGGAARPPVPICQMQLAPTTELSPWWMAEIPWGPESGGRWFVKLQAAKGHGAIRLQLLSDRVTPGIALPQPVSSASSDVYSCMRGSIPSRSIDPKLSEAFFQGSYALTIRTHLPEYSLTREVRGKVIDALLAAINNWRAACILCSPYQFSVVDVDGTVYVPERMLQGAVEDYRATFMHNYPWQKDLWREKYTGYFVLPSQFIAVSGSARQRNRFCIQKDELESGFSARLSPLCRPTTISNTRERIINLTWPTTTLDCTPGAEEATNVVACWNQTDVIKFNLRDFSYYAGDIGTVLLGHGTRRVDLIRVFTHEVGHWLGLGHLNGPETIMSGRFSIARCIDDLAMDRVNAIAIGAAPRATTPAALTYD